MYMYFPNKNKNFTSFFPRFFRSHKNVLNL